MELIGIIFLGALSLFVVLYGIAVVYGIMTGNDYVMLLIPNWAETFLGFLIGSLSVAIGAAMGAIPHLYALAHDASSRLLGLWVSFGILQFCLVVLALFAVADGAYRWFEYWTRRSASSPLDRLGAGKYR